MWRGVVLALVCLGVNVYALVAPPLPARVGGRGRLGPVRAVDPFSLGDAAPHHLASTLELAAIQGRTCVDDTGWWCTGQNGFEGFIESIHGFIHDGLGVTDGSWGLTIILITACVRLLIFPLNYISYEATDRNKALKPYMEKIKERYGEDTQAVNMATAKLYEMTETNPLAGCLPAFAQIPVFIGLYRSVLNLAFAKKIGEGFLWLPNLEGPTYDNGRGIGWLTENWVDGAPSLGWHDTLAFLALPCALVLTQSVSMRVLTPPPDPSDESAQRAQRILKYLPLMIGWFSANVPSGLGLYWMTSNVLSVAGSVGAKAYLKQNPPKLDVELAELGLDDGSAGVKLPTTLEEALVEARVNARPDRAPLRPGVDAVPVFFALDTFAAAAPPAPAVQVDELDDDLLVADPGAGAGAGDAPPRADPTSTAPSYAR